jgi:hypothetical protein
MCNVLGSWHTMGRLFKDCQLHAGGLIFYLFFLLVNTGILVFFFPLPVINNEKLSMLQSLTLCMGCIIKEYAHLENLVYGVSFYFVFFQTMHQLLR